MPISLKKVFVIAALVVPVACGGADERASGSEAEASSTPLTSGGSVLERGMSQDEVRNRLGEPRTRVTMEGSYERWTYYSYDSQGQIASKTLIIFGNDGKIVEVNDM